MDDGGPAFPLVFFDEEAMVSTRADGMSLRDWFAGQALVAGQSRCENWWPQPEQTAAHAYRVADALLAEREMHDA